MYKKSNMSTDPKMKFFTATVESIQLYGCEAWDFNKSNGHLDQDAEKGSECSLQQQNKELYRGWPALSEKIASRRLQLAGHCHRHPELCAHKLILWEPTHGHRGRGRPKTTFLDVLKSDTGAENAEELAGMMSDRKVWKSHMWFPRPRAPH